jgi:hypothetical protein
LIVRNNATGMDITEYLVNGEWSLSCMLGSCLIVDTIAATWIVRDVREYAGVTIDAPLEPYALTNMHTHLRLQ